MFLRHIQLICSPLVKTWKIEKCFIVHNNFPDKLASWLPLFLGLEPLPKTGQCINIQ